MHMIRQVFTHCGIIYGILVMANVVVKRFAVLGNAQQIALQSVYLYFIGSCCKTDLELSFILLEVVRQV